MKKNKIPRPKPNPCAQKNSKLIKKRTNKCDFNMASFSLDECFNIILPFSYPHFECSISLSCQVLHDFCIDTLYIYVVFFLNINCRSFLFIRDFIFFSWGHIDVRMYALSQFCEFTFPFFAGVFFFGLFTSFVCSALFCWVQLILTLCLPFYARGAYTPQKRKKLKLIVHGAVW